MSIPLYRGGNPPVRNGEVTYVPASTNPDQRIIVMLGTSGGWATPNYGLTLKVGDRVSVTMIGQTLKVDAIVWRPAANITPTPAATTSSSTPAPAPTPAPSSESLGSVRSDGTYSDAQIKILAKKAGFPDDQLAMAVAICRAESGGNPKAVNHNSNGSYDEGLWQINDINAGVIRAEGGNRYDPWANARMAYTIWKYRRNWTPWSTYNNGAYRKFLK